jgi:hypothetical protein
MAPSGLLKGQDSEESSFDKEQMDQHLASKYKGLEIINQHGPIFITSWDKDSISIEVHVKVSAPGEEIAQEVLDKITILTSEKAKKLVYKTLIGEDFFFNYPYTVQYNVYLPANTPLDIQNRFGDITLSSVNGPLNVSLEYGHLIQQGIEPIIRLTGALTFSDAKLTNLSSAEIKLSNAQVDLKEAANLNISGSFCQAEIDKVKTLTINASTGRFNIGQVQNLSITGDHSYPAIGEITETGNIEISDGLVVIRKVSDQLRELTVSNTNAPLTLTLQPELNYTLHGEVKNGQFRHYQAKLFNILMDNNTLSFSGINGTLEKSATILLFNKDADININH